MGRTKGDVQTSVRLEPKFKGTLDARCKIEFVSDLINPSTWIDSEGKNWLDSSLLIRVWNDTKENNGFYHLVTDGSDFTDINEWIKVGTGNGTDISMLFNWGMKFTSNNEILPIAENILIKKITARNISSVKIKPYDDFITDWTELVLDTDDIDIEITGGYDIEFEVVKATTKPIGRLYIFAERIVE